MALAAACLEVDRGLQAAVIPILLPLRQAAPLLLAVPLQQLARQLFEQMGDHRNRTQTLDQHIQRCNLDISLGFPFLQYS